MPSPHKELDREKLASGQLHNDYAFIFLQKLRKELLAWLKLKNNSDKYPQLLTLFTVLNRKPHDYDYGEAYINLCEILEDELERCYGEKGATVSPELAQLVKKLYDNDNGILEDIGKKLLPEIIEHRPGAVSHEEKLRDFVSASSRYDDSSPYKAGGGLARFKAMLDNNFVAGGLPTIKKYKWSESNKQPIEYRMPSQARRKKGKAKVKNTMLAFMDTFAPQKEEDKEKITYVYFNFLARDERKGFAERVFKEKKKEGDLSRALDTLEEKKHVAVITLPADDGLMDKKDFKRYQADTPLHLDAVKAQMLAILKGDSDASPKIKDFNLSKQVRAKLFAKKSAEDVFKEMLDSSIKAVGLENMNNVDDSISPAQRQAIWFHLINYELPKYVLDTLNPKGFNMSCKDAIDRGGVASAWYNLMRSFEDGNAAMSRAAFETALHGACLYVKGRGLNAHINRIWSATNEYVNAHIEELAKDPKKSWLILWRDMNCPKERIADVLENRITTAQERVKDDNGEMALTIQKLIGEIKTQTKSKLSLEYQKILLEMLGRSMGFYEYHQAPTNNKPVIEKQEIYAYQKMLARVDENGLLFKLKAWCQKILGFFRNDEAKLAGNEKLDRLGFYSHEKQEIKEELQSLLPKKSNDDTPPEPHP